MRLLLDTHVLLWAALGSERLSAPARRLLQHPESQLIFSVASLWEATIKYKIAESRFPVEPTALRNRLLANGYEELSINGEHALAVGILPAIHKDPFDRILAAQAHVEGLTLITADRKLASYPVSVKRI